jgi:hypothetical protein
MRIVALAGLALVAACGEHPASGGRPPPFGALATEVGVIVQSDSVAQRPHMALS